MLQHNLLPLNVQRKLRNGETVIAESHPAATVLWAEVMGPTAATAVGGAAAAATGVACSSPDHQLQEALRRISSQQQLLLTAADTGAAVAPTVTREQQLQGGAAAAAVMEDSGSAVSRSSSAVRLLGLDGVPEPVGVGPFPPGLSPAEAVVRLNSLYTTWEELCAKQVRPRSRLGCGAVQQVLAVWRTDGHLGPGGSIVCGQLSMNGCSAPCDVAYLSGGQMCVASWQVLLHGALTRCCCLLHCPAPRLQNVLGVDFSGSTFVAVSGHDDNPNHTRLILRAAAAMLSVAAATNQPDGSPLQVRMGIHTGPLTTGVCL